MRIHRRDPLPGHEQEVMSRRPPHSDAVAICMEAWHDLHSERDVAIASGVNGTTFWTRTVYGSIPWSSARDWCRAHRLDHENTALLWAVIQQLDAQRLEREASQRNLNGGS